MDICASIYSLRFSTSFIPPTAIHLRHAQWSFSFLHEHPDVDICAVSKLPVVLRSFQRGILADAARRCISSPFSCVMCCNTAPS